MRSIPPLIESSSNDRARELLRAARADRPLPSSAQRTLLALGVAAGASTATATATAAAATAASSAKLGLGAGAASSGAASLPLIAVKWLLVGTLGGVTLASGAALFVAEGPASSSSSSQVRATPSGVERPHVSAPRPRPASEAAQAEPAPQALEATERQEPDEPARRLPSAAPRPVSLEAERQASSAPSQAAFNVPEHKLLHDIGLLDAARSALRRGDAAQALRELLHYEAARQTRTLDQEAQLLRIDAWLASGERARARQLASAYLSVHPADVHSARLRALLAD